MRSLTTSLDSSNLALLYIDSTYDISLGLLDENYKWISFKSFPGQKASQVLQAETWKLLEVAKIHPQKLTGIVTTSGPGFYTGLRLSEGFADVLKFFGVPHYSFYSYEVPAWCGVDDGEWFTKAYRGEYFIYTWDKNKNSSKLITVKELLPMGKVYIHSQSSLDEKAQIGSSISTLELIKEFPEKVFARVINEKLSREAFYFRAPEDEYKVNP